MADNVPITPGTGVNVAADERTIGAGIVQVQRVMETGGSAFAVGVASVTTTSGSAISARDTRKTATLKALPANTANIDVGPSGVASGSGLPLEPGESVDLPTTAAIHADAAAGTQALAYAEFYD